MLGGTNLKNATSANKQPGKGNSENHWFLACVDSRDAWLQDRDWSKNLSELALLRGGPFGARTANS